MNYVNVKFSSEAREKIIEGVNLITDCISVSYGPNGKQVAIKTNGGVKVTKDGSTIANSVNDPDPYISMGVEMIREISQKTSTEVGDGSSTVAILSRAIVEQYKDYSDPTLLSRSLQKFSSEALKWLETKKLEVSSSDLTRVATLAANNDKQIGEIIAEAYNTVGKDGLVTFEESDGTQDRVEYTKGFRIESGYASPYFINTNKNSCELENVFVYISDIKMEDMKKVMELCEQALKRKQSLALIAPGFDSECLVFLKANLDVVKSCCITSPNYRNYRQIMIEDIRDILGESSTCQKLICDTHFTTFIGYESNKEKVKEKVEYIQSIIEENSISQFDLDFHKKRLAVMTSGIATIKIGGYSPTEISSKLDLYEDAVNSTYQALKYGIVPGGGKALELIAQNFVFSKELEPFKKVLETPTTLLNTREVSWDQMLEKGILEPFSTCKQTLENAVSIASQILSCDCAILNVVNYE